MARNCAHDRGQIVHIGSGNDAAEVGDLKAAARQLRAAGEASWTTIGGVLGPIERPEVVIAGRCRNGDDGPESWSAAASR